MMTNRFSIKAFTIMEVVITMVLTAIVISITYTAYSIVSRSYLQYQKKNDEMAELILMDKLLKRDVDKADTILKTDSGFVCDEKAAVVNYKIDSGKVVRVALTADTFKFHLQDMNMLFENQPINSSSANTEAGRLDDISFRVVFHNDLIPYHYHKAYSSADLLTRNTNAIN
jgi:type II secretory pathway component PulJ